MTADLPRSNTAIASTRVLSDDVPIVLACRDCEVTWRDVVGAPCWFCGETGAVAHPERIVLD